MSHTTPERDAQSETIAEQTAELAVLREENERLREEYARARQHKHRQSALALTGIGVLAVLVAILFPGVRDVLIVIGAIGLFGAVLTYYLTPERVTTASVVESIHDTHAGTLTALTEELGLQDDRIYLPVEQPDERARLFVPQHANYSLPADRSRLFVGLDEDAARGICLPAVGATLLDVLEPNTPQEDTPDGALAFATESLVEQFELSRSVDYDLQEGTATITTRDVRPRDLTTTEHPVVSLCGIVLAATLEQPVRVGAVDDEQVTFAWDSTETGEE